MDQINIEININGKSYRVCENNIIENSYENPYEFIGKAHNEFLEEYYDKKMSIEEIVKESNIWFQNKFNQKIINTEGIVNKSLDGDLYGILEKEDFTPCVKEKLHSIFTAIIKPKSYDIWEVIKSVLVIEEKIYNNESISKRDKEIIFATTSIARNSLEFWDRKYTQEDSKAQKKRPFWDKFWKVVKVSAVDIAAGALGTLVGPIVGGAAAGAASKAAS